MDLKKLPPSLLAVLGLACARTPPTVGPCLSQPYDPSAGEVGPCLSPPAEDPAEPTEPEPEPTEPEPPVGPCLSPPAPSTSVSDASGSSVSLDVADAVDVTDTACACGPGRACVDGGYPDAGSTTECITYVSCNSAACGPLIACVDGRCDETAPRVDVPCDAGVD